MEAARLEFEEHGFDGTNSNAIAKRADYAPQTFYRHFADKRAIFLAVYKDWTLAEARDVADAVTPEGIADALIQHHQAHRIFRRSLRTLTASDSEVGKARADARLDQVHSVERRTARSDSARILASILMIERLCDAIADGEFAACGVSDEDSRALLVGALRRLFLPPTE